MSEVTGQSSDQDQPAEPFQPVGDRQDTDGRAVSSVDPPALASSSSTGDKVANQSIAALRYDVQHVLNERDAEKIQDLAVQVGLHHSPPITAARLDRPFWDLQTACRRVLGEIRKGDTTDIQGVVDELAVADRNAGLDMELPPHWTGSRVPLFAEAAPQIPTDQPFRQPTPAAPSGPPRQPPPPATAANGLTLRSASLASLGAFSGAALGSLLPWVTIRTGFGSVSVSGTDGDGILTLLLALVGGGSMFAAFAGLNHKVAGVAGFVAASLIVLIGGNVLINTWSTSSGNADVAASAGVGLYLTILGGFAAGILALNSLNR